MINDDRYTVISPGRLISPRWGSSDEDESVSVCRALEASFQTAVEVPR